LVGNYILNTFVQNVFDYDVFVNITSTMGPDTKSAVFYLGVMKEETASATIPLNVIPGTPYVPPGYTYLNGSQSDCQNFCCIVPAKYYFVYTIGNSSVITHYGTTLWSQPI
jgi:hypothetical protein